MVEIGTIFQNAILYVAGNEGMEKLSKAGYDQGIDRIVRPDGSLDLPQLMNVLLDVFPEEQASAIADNVLAKYVEMSDEAQKKARAAADDKAPGPALEDDMLYEDNLARYLSTEASDVRDLISEARRIRLAMGKTAAMKVTLPEPVGEPVPGPVITQPEMPVISLVAPFMPPKEETVAIEAPKPEPELLRRAELSEEALNGEILKFVMARKAYTSVDIMDFIRYLKDKGYHFQENNVLEDVYTWLEERKDRERAALMADILAFLERLPWPTEDEVSAFIEQKKSEGAICESSEIKRMILVEMIRKH